MAFLHDHVMYCLLNKLVYVWFHSWLVITAMSSKYSGAIPSIIIVSIIMDGLTDGRREERKGKLREGGANGWMEGCTDRQTNGRMDG